MSNRTNIDLLDYMIPSLLRSLFKYEPDNVTTVKLNFTLIENTDRMFEMLYYIRPLGIHERKIDYTFNLIKGENSLLEVPTVKIYPEDLSVHLREHFSLLREACLDYLMSLFSRFIGTNAYQVELSVNEGLLKIQHEDVTLLLIDRSKSKNS